MKAAYIDQVGPPENIRYGELPMPALGQRDVLVKVAAVCVDPVDTYIRSGRLPMQLPRPFIIGRDVVGVVEQVGPAVRRYQAGDRVWSNCQGFAGRQGTFAEYLASDETLLYPVPAGGDDRELVAFVHSGLTACIGLARANVQRGESLFIGGGAGNVGSAVLQLAKARGARVLATAGNDDGLAWCGALGADAVVNYKSGDVAQAVREFSPGGVDVHWDTSGRPDFDQAVGLLAHGGRIVVMAGFDARPFFPVGPFYVKDASLLGFAITYASREQYDETAAEINAWVARGGLRVRIDRVLPLAEAATAHRLIDDRAPLAGKVVLVP